MEKPHVEDVNLKKTVDELYKPNGEIGNGSTAAAIRHEVQTGLKVRGKYHSQKGADRLRRLETWERTHPTAASGDRAAVENLILDLKDALGN